MPREERNKDTMLQAQCEPEFNQISPERKPNHTNISDHHPSSPRISASAAPLHPSSYSRNISNLPYRAAHHPVGVATCCGLKAAVRSSCDLRCCCLMAWENSWWRICGWMRMRCGVGRGWWRGVVGGRWVVGGRGRGFWGLGVG